MEHLKRPYREVFPQIYVRIMESANRMIEKIISGQTESHPLAFGIALLSGDYESIGIGECVLHSNPKKAKQYFYLSAKLRELLFLHYDHGGSIHVNASWVTMGNYKTLFCALLSDCDDLIDSLAHLIGGRPEEEAEHGHPFADNVGYAMKYILLGEYNKAQHHVDQLQAIADDPELEFVRGYVPVLRGIIRTDARLVHEGLALQLNLHKQDPEHQDQPEEIFSLQVLGLAKLAIRKGISVELNDPLTPNIMLQKHHMEYPPVDFLPLI